MGSLHALPDGLVEIAHRQLGLVSLRQMTASGLTWPRIGRLERAGLARRVVRGVDDLSPMYPELAAAASTYDGRRRRTAVLGVLAHGPLAVATGLAALVLHGVRGVPDGFTPEVTLQHGGPATPIPGVRLRRERVRAVMRCDGVSVVVPEVALAQAVREVERMPAIALMDSARSQRLVTDSAFERARALAAGRPGAAQARTWWDESTPLSKSPAETFARLRCAEAGFAPDELQFEVTDERGAFVARVDLAWRLPGGRMLLGEVDGVAYHSGRRDVLSDLARQNRLVSDGTILLRWTGTQAMNGELTRAVADILRREGWRPPGRQPHVGRLPDGRRSEPPRQAGDRAAA